MHVDICVCTHNPRLELLRTVITSIAAQETNPDFFSVLLIDNGSKHELQKDLLAPLVARNIKCKIIQESHLGLSRARIRAIQETTDEWILFVDDDNVLMPDFLECGLSFIKSHADVGCFGGRLLLPNTIKPQRWVTLFLPYLGIKDEGDKVIFGAGEHWGPWEPAGAGAWVHRKVLNEYVLRSKEDERLFKLGRTGKGNLASCDDSIMMRGAHAVGLKNAYVPNLVLMHHLDINRFNFLYVIRLMYAYGISHVTLETILRGPQPVPEYYKSSITFIRLISSIFLGEGTKSVQYAIGMIAYHLGARCEHSRNNHGVIYERHLSF
jgi:glycosyltransferase involved in cell wall biosynthesis